jgi:hypothetical protein
MAALEDVFAQTMPREMGYDYMGMSFQEKKPQQGVPATAIFGFSLLFVFLILAALYESWSLPFSVLLRTPVAVFGAFAVLWLRRCRPALIRCRRQSYQRTDRRAGICFVAAPRRCTPASPASRRLASARPALAPKCTGYYVTDPKGAQP